MLDLIIIGAGPAGISMGVEAVTAGIDPENILILEKGEAHSWAIRKFYPEKKLVAANYKGNCPVCHGVMCIDDMTKSETLSFLDQAVHKHHLKINYNESVSSIRKLDDIFEIHANNIKYRAKVCVISIGILGRPNRPKYKIPPSLKSKVHFDITSTEIRESSVLVVGGGDSASEYVQYLVEEKNNVALSYRKNEFTRMNEINRASILELQKRNQVEIFYESNVKTLNEDGESVSVQFEEKELGMRQYDHIVYALGGSTPKNFLALIGIAFDGEEPVVNEGYETSIPGLFLIGDLSSGRKGGSIISAFNSSQTAMRKICTSYLDCAKR